MFIILVNIKENFALVYDESSNIIQNLMRSKFSILYVVLIISEALFVIITVLVTYNCKLSYKFKIKILIIN